MTRVAIVDTETTGLTLPDCVELDKQPRIIELGVLIIDDGKITSEHEWMVDPGDLPLPEVITKITGIRTEDLIGKPRFKDILEEVKPVFKDVDIFIAHNAPFDKSLILYDLARCGCEDFPWPGTIICTAQEYTHVMGKRPTEKALYEYIMGKPLAQTHRALDDVKALYEILDKDNFFEYL